MVGETQRGVKRLEQGLMFRVRHIPEQKFREADERQKIELLLEQFGTFMFEAGVNLNENLLCPYHDDQNPSMTYYPDTKKFFCHARCYETTTVLKDSSKNNTPHKDAFDLIRDLLDLSSFSEAYNKLVGWFVENPKQFYKSTKPYRKSSEKKTNSGSCEHKLTKRVLGTKDSEVKQYLLSLIHI